MLATRPLPAVITDHRRRRAPFNSKGPYRKADGSIGLPPDSRLPFHSLWDKRFVVPTKPWEKKYEHKKAPQIWSWKYKKKGYTQHQAGASLKWDTSLHGPSSTMETSMVGIFLWQRMMMEKKSASRLCSLLMGQVFPAQHTVQSRYIAKFRSFQAWKVGNEWAFESYFKMIWMEGFGGGRRRPSWPHLCMQWPRITDIWSMGEGLNRVYTPVVVHLSGFEGIKFRLRNLFSHLVRRLRTVAWGNFEHFFWLTLKES